MAEFDFDALDKAVSDLMSTVETDKRNPQLDDPEDNVVTLSSSATPRVPAEPAAPTVAPRAAAPVQATAASSSPLATKRRGQFMDIMSPSQAKSNKQSMGSRQGVTIQPSAPASTPVETIESAAPEVPTVESLAPIEDSSQSTWPDPIEMTTSATSEAPVEVAAETPAEATTEPLDDVAPLTTPFLANAKVEKRPLGTNESITISDSTEDAAADAQVSPTAETTAPVIALPEELTGDVMAVESNDLSKHISDTPYKEAEPKEATKTEEPVKLAEDLAPVQEGLPEPTGPVSIQQQYTEQPSTGDQSSGSIYDTSTYHQAIDGEAVPKKHSSLKWVIIIAILLVVGAAGGAAAFYFTR